MERPILFGWLKKRKQRIQKEARWTVAVDDTEICITDHEGNTKSVAKTELSRVMVETNDTGPWGTDVWWLLFGENQQLTCAFPHGATGYQLATDYFARLEGFDHAALIAAMGSTQNAFFPVWRKAS